MDEDVTKFDRQTNFELLRVFAMFMITAYHYTLWGVSVWPENIGNRIFLELWSMLGTVGVNLFVLISGYFGIYSCFKVKKIIKLEVQTLFFSILCMLCLARGNLIQLSITDIIKNMFPNVFNQWWFITAYIVLYLLSPYINRLLLLLNKREFLSLIFLILIMWCVIPSLSLQISSAFNWSPQIWMISMYVMGAYIRRFPFQIKRGISLGLIMTMFSIGLICFPIALVEALHLDFINIDRLIAHIRISNSIPVVWSSLSIFTLFKELRLHSNKAINYVAGSAFSVYLLQENIFFRPVLWNNILRCDIYALSSGIYVHAIFSLFFIYFLGMAAQVLF